MFIAKTEKERRGELTRQKRIPWEFSTPSLQRLSQTEHKKGLHDDGLTTSRMSYPSIEEIAFDRAIVGLLSFVEKGEKVFSFMINGSAPFIRDVRGRVLPGDVQLEATTRRN